jgi:hypothetical protein
MTTFTYYAILGSSGDGPPRGLLAVLAPNNPVRAALWDHAQRRWSAYPDIVVPILHGPAFDNRKIRVDRIQAEQIASAQLGTELPTEDGLRQIIAEDLATGRTPMTPTGRLNGDAAALANEDWLADQHWDLPDSLPELLLALDVPEDAPEEQRRAALIELTRLAAWDAAPAALRTATEAYLGQR